MQPSFVSNQLCLVFLTNAFASSSSSFSEAVKVAYKALESSYKALEVAYIALESALESAKLTYKVLTSDALKRLHESLSLFLMFSEEARTRIGPEWIALVDKVQAILDEHKKKKKSLEGSSSNENVENVGTDIAYERAQAAFNMLNSAITYYDLCLRDTTERTEEGRNLIRVSSAPFLKETTEMRARFDTKGSELVNKVRLILDQKEEEEEVEVESEEVSRVIEPNASNASSSTTQYHPNSPTVSIATIETDENSKKGVPKTESSDNSKASNVSSITESGFSENSKSVATVEAVEEKETKDSKSESKLASKESTRSTTGARSSATSRSVTTAETGEKKETKDSKSI